MLPASQVASLPLPACGSGLPTPGSSFGLKVRWRHHLFPRVHASPPPHTCRLKCARRACLPSYPPHWVPACGPAVLPGTLPWSQGQVPDVGGLRLPAWTFEFLFYHPKLPKLYRHITTKLPSFLQPSTVWLGSLHTTEAAAQEPHAHAWLTHSPHPCPHSPTPHATPRFPTPHPHKHPTPARFRHCIRTRWVNGQTYLQLPAGNSSNRSIDLGGVGCYARFQRRTHSHHPTADPLFTVQGGRPDRDWAFASWRTRQRHAPFGWLDDTTMVRLC